jgi:SNF2 family DNA or RNA helicase
MARVDFIYGDNIVSLDNNNKIITYFDGDKLVNYKRNIAAERILMQQLPNNAEGFPLDYANKYISNLSIPNEYLRNLIAIDGDEFIDEGLMENFWVQFQMEAVPKLRKAGWEITIDENFPYQITVADDEWYTKIDDSSGIDWFGLELGVNIGGKSVNLLPILLEALKHIDADLLASDTPPDVEYLVLPTQQGGEKVALPAARVWEMLRFLKDLYGGNQLESDGTLRMSRLEAANLAELEELSSSLNMRWFGGDKLLKLGNELRNFTGIKQIIPPKSLKAELRDYQKDGLNWMQFLREYQLAGVLADDMGLGKTIQALAYIMYEKEQSRLDKPILVVAPTSVLVNWRMETERFAPTLKTLVLHGSDRKQYFNQISDAELVLTTYPLLYRDKEIWLAQEFHTIILDEAQYIKNSKAKNTQIACQIKADNRICMTGTPIENHLGELWSQFNFLLPGFLGDEKQFRQFFRNPIEKSGDADRNAALARRVKPFMLRRTKQEIATELPPKTVIIRTASLDKAQRDLYEVIRISMQQKVQEEIAKKGLSRSHIVVLEALLRLRQTCCDPRLLKMEAANKVKASAKLEMLMDMVPEMVEEGRNILIFSQFTSMLSLIASELDNHKLKYVKITGQTKDRKTPIEKFQNGKVPIFLISLKAGGTGLNLTAADTVIHYDPWWNPAAENQATDRAYRIGQDKPVFVYKLLTEKTVEEKILEMQEKKASLAAGIFDPKGKAATALTQDDINALFEPL